MTPLSTEKTSVGKPAIFQALIFIGSPRVLLKEKVSEQGIFFFCKKRKIEKKKKTKKERKKKQQTFITCFFTSFIKCLQFRWSKYISF